MPSFPKFTTGVSILPERWSDRLYVPSAWALAIVIPVALIVFGGWSKLPVAITFAVMGSLSALTFRALFANERNARAAGLESSTLEFRGLSAIIPGLLMAAIMLPIFLIGLLLSGLGMLISIVGTMSRR